MSIFEFVTVAISIVLGLGVAELLSSALDLFRYRRTTRWYWVPAVWGGLIFLIQLEFWWSLFALQEPGVWTHGAFLLAVSTALSLFAAGSLILPRRWPEEGVDLRETFRGEGKAGVGAFALFNLLAIPLNSILFQSPLFSVVTLFIGGMLLCQLVVLLSRSERWVGVFTLLYAVLQLGILTYSVVPQFTT